MAWTSETYVGNGWTVYYKDALAGGSAEEIDTREATRVMITATGTDVTDGGAGTGDPVLQFAMAPTATAAGSTWKAPPDETGQTANTDIHNDVCMLSRSVLPPWIRISNSSAASGDTVTHTRVLVKRVSDSA